MLEDILAQLTPEQRTYALARLDFATDTEVAAELGWKVQKIYNWRSSGAPIDEAVLQMQNDGIQFALFERRRALGKAMKVKVSGLGSEDEKVRQNVATEIIEWELGKAQQRMEHGLTQAATDYIESMRAARAAAIADDET